MNSKILFWLGPDYTHYCISHYLQKLYDCDLYGIIDIPNKQKTFFEKQNLVNFKKTWYIFDNILKNHKSNMENLVKFEKNYGVNLWNLAINERHFYRFNLEKFSDEQILSILEQGCTLFEKIIDEIKPDFLITKWASRHYHQLLIDLCVKKGVKVIQLGQPKIGYKMLISQDPSKIDGVINLNHVTTKNRSFEELQKFIKKFNMTKHQKEFDTKKQTKLGFLNTGIEYIFSKNDLDDNHYDYFFGSGKWKNIRYILTSPNKRKSRKKFLDSLTENIPSKPFVYYPLAVDMERNLLINAPFYTNQIEIIRHIAKSLPINYTLVVKENPAQVSRDWRSLSDYKEIMEIPNVLLINPNVSYDELLKKSSLVVLIGGTTGFEAAFYGKSSITFSDMIYSLLPSVFRVKNLEELPDLIQSALMYKPESDSLDKYLNLIEENSFDFDYLDFLNKFSNTFYREDRLTNVDIPESKMKEFLDKNKSILELVTNEHIKKMEWHKNNG
tara:strand:- start:2750 stop:4243 length:1494 start_codon:yes stop_codon:yes gene_type:complete